MKDDPVTPNQVALEQAIAAFRQMPVPDRPADAELLARFDALQPFGPLPIARLPKRKLASWAILPYAAAASILLGIAGWALFGRTGSLALAEVIQAARSHHFVRYKQGQIVDDVFKGPTAPDRTVLADLRSFRIRSASRVIDGNMEYVVVITQDARKNRNLSLSTDTDLHTGKIVTKLAVVELCVREDFRPLRGFKPYQPLLDQLRELQNHKATAVTKEPLNGRKTVKYRLEDDGTAIAAWVDPTTKLPVRMENEMTAPDGLRYKFAFTDFEWDPEVKDIDQLFSVEPPGGCIVRDYTREERRGQPQK
jgi:hypothetical protein